MQFEVKHVSIVDSIFTNIRPPKHIFCLSDINSGRSCIYILLQWPTEMKSMDISSPSESVKLEGLH